jgi:metal-dependent amidase/aminoacylase/carboxypeptidase family protein
MSRRKTLNSKQQYSVDTKNPSSYTQAMKKELLTKIKKGRDCMIREHLAEAISWRRSLHRCPQPAWLEFFATAFVADKLTQWGYEVKQGREIIQEGRQLLLPDARTLEKEYQRALKAGAKAEFLEKAKEIGRAHV